MKTKFLLGDRVKHYLGAVFTIVAVPDENDLLEDSAESFYKYTAGDHCIKWNLRQDEFEDGRFILVAEGPEE